MSLNERCKRDLMVFLYNEAASTSVPLLVDYNFLSNKDFITVANFGFVMPSAFGLLENTVAA